MIDGLVGAYRVAAHHDQPFHDETVHPSGDVRFHYRMLGEIFDQLGVAELERRVSLRETVFRDRGITFTVYGEEEGIERTWPMDLFPRIIQAREWEIIEQGLIQRVTALNLFLDDLYVGEQAVIRDGIIPRSVIVTSDGFEREAMHIPVPSGARCLVAGIDIVRDGSGRFVVLEDNLRNPSGISYVVENRSAMHKVLPGAFREYQIREVDRYGQWLLAALKDAAPPASGDSPVVVVLTPGVFNSAYYEHAFLARQMGVELVEGRDLVVDEHVVAMRTSQGLRRVDVIYRRIDDHFLDPVVFRPDSTLGVPGLMAAARAGTVTVANAVGNGVADDKAVYPYVPDLIRYYLGAEPILQNVATYDLGDPDQLAEAVGRLDELVVKPVSESGGKGIVIGPSADAETLDQARRDITDDPRNWVVQEVVSLSRMPCFVDSALSPRHIDLRPFLVAGRRPVVVPGGLTRVAMREGSLVVNSSMGGGSKDTWVLAPTVGRS